MITFIILNIILIFLILLIILLCNTFLTKKYIKKDTQNNYVNNVFQKNNYVNNIFQKNILGTELITCCDATGFNRDGMCSSNIKDIGTHIICAIVDDNFLQFTKSKGNDLMTPSNLFKGLVDGDKWCLCISRWIQAYKEGKAPKIIPESTNELALKYISKEILMQYSIYYYIFNFFYKIFFKLIYINFQIYIFVKNGE